MQTRISANGGTEPAWSPNGREIFYRTVGEAEPKLMSATLRLEPTVSVTSWRTLFSVVDMIATQPHVGYDVSPDGKTFVMVKRIPAERIMVLQNLQELMKQ
jgi:Tol biopolymer transport system component